MLEVAGVEGEGFGPAPSLLAGRDDDGPVLTESLYALTTPFPRERLEEFGLLISVRKGSNKYIWREETELGELFDTSVDPTENIDLAGDAGYAAITQDLDGLVQARVRGASVADARAGLRRRVRDIARELRGRNP
jgi:hypothetical protein